MYQDVVPALAETYRNFVLIGESGAGKTEVALCLGRELRALTGRPVHIFDLDQTKPLFRARDLADQLAAEGVAMHAVVQKLDEPTLAPGVIESLQDKSVYTILDVGGDVAGTRMIGRFAHVLNGADTGVFFLINSYRPWSQSAESIGQTLHAVARAGRFARVRLISNPNLGPSTTAEEVIAGHERLLRLLDQGMTVDFLAVHRPLCAAVRRAVPLPVLPLSRHIAYPGSD